MRKTLLPVLALLAASALPAAAHVTLDRTTLPANAYPRIAFGVGHGCGGEPTTAIRILLPEGLRVARPMPVAGWEIAIAPGGTPAAAADPHAGHGGHAAHAAPPPATAPASVTWTGGMLADQHYGEFVLLIRTPDEPGAELRFRVVQECANGKRAEWDNVAHLLPR